MVYFTKDTELPPFVPLPRFIIDSDRTINAKLVYGFLLNRAMLSRENGWADEHGNVFVIYTIKQLADDLYRSERTVKTALKELDDAGLIVRVRKGYNRANRIFVMVPDEVQGAAPARGNSCTTDRQDSAHRMGQNMPANNKEYNYNNFNYINKNKKFGNFKNKAKREERRYAEYTYEEGEYL